jgi:hypothetical protein
MALFRLPFAAAAVLLMGAGAVQATEPSPARQRVYVCERPTPARHVVHQEHGRMAFVTAKQLLSDVPVSEEPRCITAAQLERLRTLSAQRSRMVASR